jgi:hypothetical protein
MAIGIVILIIQKCLVKKQFHHYLALIPPSLSATDDKRPRWRLYDADTRRLERKKFYIQHSALAKYKLIVEPVKADE